MNLYGRCFISSKTCLFCQKQPIIIFAPGEQETNTACSPRGQVEVSMKCHASAPLTLLPFLLLLPHSCDKESQFGCQGNRLFPWRCWNTWEGQGGFVSPVMKDSPYACLIARLMVPNPTAEPIYHSLIMFTGASDTVILPVLSRCAVPHRGHLSYCCTVFLMSTAETTDSQTKQGRHTCVSLAVTEIRLDK